jgi:hypothetical protein
MQYVNRVVAISTPLYNYRITSGSLYQNGKDRLSQFNHLYSRYMLWSEEVGIIQEQEAFRKEMGRLTYYHHLNAIEERVKRKNRGFVAMWQEYTVELKRINPGVFYFPAIEQSNLNSFKKKLLEKGRFKFFALIVVTKSKLFRRKVL